MANFHVELSIYNDFVVEADNEEEATAKVLALGVWESLDGADYNVSEVREEEEK